MTQRLVLLFITCALLVLPNTTFAKSQKNSIPNIERWELAQNSKDPTGVFTSEFFGHPTKINFTWYKDPNKGDFYGGVVYHIKQGKKISVVKIWNLKLQPSGKEYVLTDLMAAIALWDGTWIVGDVGEQVSIKEFFFGTSQDGVRYGLIKENKEYVRAISFEN